MKKLDRIKSLFLLVILLLVLVGIVFYSNMMHLACFISLALALVTGSIFTHYLNTHSVSNLEHQETLRKQLTADVAHELRTPLTTISTHLEMMMEGVWQATPERLQTCYDEIGRLEKMVADLERLAKFDGEVLELEKAPHDLWELVKTEAEHFPAVIHVTGEPAVLPLDRARISQVLINLLSNAVKYSGEGAFIHVTVQNSPKYARLLVEDNGHGISEEDLPYIFERFYRAEKSRNRSTGGTGLGLTISKNIVEAHGGQIWAESQLGKGSKFIVELPK